MLEVLSLFCSGDIPSSKSFSDDDANSSNPNRSILTNKEKSELRVPQITKTVTILECEDDDSNMAMKNEANVDKPRKTSQTQNLANVKRDKCEIIIQYIVINLCLLHKKENYIQSIMK